MSLSTQVNYREPATFAAGDTLIFQKYLADYLPSNGWSLLYEIRGGSQPITFASSALGDYHAVEVAATVTAPWLPADCVLVGFAVNGAEKHQIYYGELNISAPVGALQNQEPQTTHAQRMISLLEAALEKLAAHVLDSTNVEQTEIRRANRLELEKQLAMNKEIRANEVAHENIRNGRPSGMKISSQFNIINAGASRAVNQTANIV